MDLRQEAERRLPLGLLLVGFTIMSLTSNFNVVPAGLGVSEALLAFTFKHLGVSFEVTLVAALLYRFVFFLIPLAVSTALYLDILRSFLKNQGKSGREPAFETLPHEMSRRPKNN